MLFLLNDVVFDLADVTVPRALSGRGFRALSLDDVLHMGRELYAEHPLLHSDRPGRARRLAGLLRAKAPSINAALFVAPAYACAVDEVSVRVASASAGVMASLQRRQQAGELDTLSADREVWRRLAA